MLLGFLQIGTSEMLFIVFIALLLFGGKKLPELARGLGKGIREFKDASESIKREISDQINSFEKDLDIESAVIDDAELDRQRKLAKAQTENQGQLTDGQEGEDAPKIDERSETVNETDGVETDSNLGTDTKKAEKVYKDPRMQAIFTPPAGTYQHQQGREPDYESNFDSSPDDSKPQV